MLVTVKSPGGGGGTVLLSGGVMVRPVICVPEVFFSVERDRRGRTAVGSLQN